MNVSNGRIPAFFRWLIASGAICCEDVLHTEDGFFALNKSLHSILLSKGIETFPDRDGLILECKNFFDDWFLYVVSDEEKEVYSLFKMREQEHDREQGRNADGDTPGVTISFITFDIEILKVCMEASSYQNRKKLGIEINRVVAYPKQHHDPVLKAYFIRPEAEGSYLIADLYTDYLASSAVSGVLNVPDAYHEIYGNRRKNSRIPDFIDQNNRKAEAVICDHEKIYLKNPDCLSNYEKLAILATHCGNVSLHSFAAEVRYHAMFLSRFAKVKIPIVGSPYASAVRADMSIGDKEFQGLAPYYNLRSKLVLEQERCHKNW